MHSPLRRLHREDVDVGEGEEAEAGVGRGAGVGAAEQLLQLRGTQFKMAIKRAAQSKSALVTNAMYDPDLDATDPVPEGPAQPHRAAPQGPSVSAKAELDCLCDRVLGHPLC